MSRHAGESPSTHHIKSGGTIHIETDNPALLSLVCEDSSTQLTRFASSAENRFLCVEASSSNPVVEHQNRETVNVSHPDSAERIITSANSHISIPFIEHDKLCGSQDTRVSSTNSKNHSAEHIQLCASVDLDSNYRQTKSRETANGNERSEGNLTSDHTPIKTPPLKRAEPHLTSAHTSVQNFSTEQVQLSALPVIGATDQQQNIDSQTKLQEPKSAEGRSVSSSESVILPTFEPSSIVSVAKPASETSAEADEGEDADDEGDGDNDDTNTNVDVTKQNDLSCGGPKSNESLVNSEREHSSSTESLRVSESLAGHRHLSSSQSLTLYSPDHHKHVLSPYSSRRLKNRSPSRSSAVSIAVINEQGIRTSLHLPTDGSHRVDQPAAEAQPGSTYLVENKRQNIRYLSENKRRDTRSSFSNIRTGDNYLLEVPVKNNGHQETIAHVETQNETDLKSSVPRSNRHDKSELEPLLQDNKSYLQPASHASYLEHKRYSSSGERVGTKPSEVYPRLEDVSDTVSTSHPAEQAEQSWVEGSVGRVNLYSPRPTHTLQDQYRLESGGNKSEDTTDNRSLCHGLDQPAVSSMDNTASFTSQPARKSFKQVRYQDDQDRYEDRDEMLQNGVPAKPPSQTQYVLRSKTNSADVTPDPRPVRGLTLPSGPSYDPDDEEDLKREASYQEQLKSRVESNQRTAEVTVIPHISREDMDFDFGELDRMEGDNPRHQQHRDSLDMYDQNMGSTQWPDGAPQHRFGVPQGYTDQERLGFGESGEEDYVAGPAGYGGPARFGGSMRFAPAGFNEVYNGDRYEDMHYADQQINPYDGQPRQFGPPISQSQTFRGSLGYAHQGYAEPRDGLYLTEPRGYTQKGPPVYGQTYGDEEGNPAPNMSNFDEDRYQLDDETQKNEQEPEKIDLPLHPEYDYVEHNKHDYGFSPKRTYKKIREVKKTEEEKLSHIFIHPKVKVKSKKGSRDSSPARPLAIAYKPDEATDQGPEELWAHQSAHLAQVNHTKIPPSYSPSYPYPMDAMQPGITQHVVTEDGQKISVDVNLRLVSPPPPGSGTQDLAAHHHHFPHTGVQYPVGGIRELRGGVHSGSHDYTDAVYSTNPYKKIPPIATGSEGSPHSPASHPQEGYMFSYLREKEKQQASLEKPWYRVYGLKDYRRMKREVELGRGTLGPDLGNDTYREKRDKMLRKLDYAKGVQEKNTKELVTKKPAAFPRPQEQDDMLSKRKLAVEYAKNVPKPTVKPKPTAFNSYEMAAKLSPIAKTSKSPESGGQEAKVKVFDLEKLHKRHQEDKTSAKLIQQKAQGLVS